MKFNIFALSATAFLFSQVFAAPADTTAVEAQPHVETDNALEADLMTLHGWDKKDTQMLTTVLESIDQLGSLVSQVSNDPTSAALLADFQSNTKQLLADAGYEYRQLDDNRRVLTRVSSENAVYHEELIRELIGKLFKAVTDALTKLKDHLSKNGVPDFITGIIDTLIKTIQKIGDMLSGGAKSSTS